LSVKIQIIGTFYFYKWIELSKLEQLYFEQIANRLQMPLQEALKDPYFYQKLQLNKYQSIEDINGESKYALITNEFHQIEVYENGIKRQKFLITDLLPDYTLFPIYPTNPSPFSKTKNNPSVIIKEKGRIVFTLPIDFKQLEEKLCFQFCSEQKLLHGFALDKTVLFSIKRDTLVVG